MRIHPGPVLGLLAVWMVLPLYGADKARLTPQEKAEGWELLFDGTRVDSWRLFRGESFPEGEWIVSDGCLSLVPSQRTAWQRFLRRIHSSLGSLERHHLITREKFLDFDLILEWKIEPGTNNGVKYFITEERGVGHEYQIIDESAERFAHLKPKYRLAAFYDVKAPDPSAVQARPIGEFNTTRIRVSGNRVETWLNDRKTVEYELGTDELQQAIAESKFSDVPDFGTKIEGHIMLTDHGDPICFRSIKVRRLGEDSPPVR